MAAFIKYELRSDALCMGERTKGGIFRPCVKTAIPYSQISGALRKKFGSVQIHAAGYLAENNGCNRTNYFAYSPRDKAKSISKVPIKLEFLSKVHGTVFVIVNDQILNLPERFEIYMGALISKGFGLCQLTKLAVLEEKPPIQGLLRTRIPLNRKEIFGIRNVLQPVYGYLFEPSSPTTGTYVLSLFENSLVIAPEFLIYPKKGG